MKRFFLLSLAAAILQAAPLLTIKTVYVFPMRNALDQYLANSLTQEHLFQVVADPKAADAVFTDHVDAGFQESFDRLVLDVKPKDEQKLPPSTIGRGHGMIFLVNKQKQVVWSTYEPAKDGSAKQTEKVARRTAEQLKKDLQPASPPAPASGS